MPTNGVGGINSSARGDASLRGVLRTLERGSRWTIGSGSNGALIIAIVLIRLSRGFSTSTLARKTRMAIGLPEVMKAIYELIDMGLTVHIWFDGSLME